MIETASPDFALVGVHHQRDVLEEAGEVLELLHGAHQLLEVFEAAGGVGGAVLLPHLRVAGFIEHDLRQLAVRRRVLHGAPAVEARDQLAQRIARARLHLVGLDDGARRLHQRDAPLAGVVVQGVERGVAEPALGHIDDALEREVVSGLCNKPQIGEGVADLHALVEPRPADHAIGQAERDEAILELAHLERGAHQDRDLVEIVRLAGAVIALELLDLLADRAGFFLRVPAGGDLHLLAGHVLGAQRLAEAALVVRDQMRGGGEDVGGGAVVALQANDLRAGKIVVEAQDVVDLGAAPAVDRLVVVADAADVFLVELCGRRGATFSGVIPGRAEGA